MHMLQIALNQAGMHCFDAGQTPRWLANPEQYSVAKL
jgi:hypothetical protein